jgi:hypothetical protein
MSTDYTRSTGNSGTMRIRDNAPGGASGTIEFWINSNNTTTFDHELPWGYSVNGVTNNTLTANYNAGMGWLLLGSWTVSASQTVTFYLRATGTSGFGGPTTFSQAISRATVPPAPSAPTFTSVGPTSLYVNFTPSGDGGSAITSYDVYYGTTSSADTVLHTGAVSPQLISGLIPGTTYYFRVRANNAVGNGAWSTIVAQATIAGVRVRDGGTWKFAVPYVKVAGVWRPAVPYVNVSGEWKGTV